MHCRHNYYCDENYLDHMVKVGLVSIYQKVKLLALGKYHLDEV